MSWPDGPQDLVLFSLGYILFAYVSSDGQISDQILHAKSQIFKHQISNLYVKSQSQIFKNAQIPNLLTLKSQISHRFMNSAQNAR